ncbi:hypothetical protein EDD99_8083 [Streptomyces sp. 846.5]|nr:hypothetical protein [Streptomyces sp. 846.5]TDT94171.1 hypothetical protein EDD99_8083 [Streptomyces sp. 846.5]
MDDAEFFDLVRARLDGEFLADHRELGEGRVQVHADEVPRLSVLLVKALIDAPTQPKYIRAADLTTDPALLARRHEYLAANRLFIGAGGSIDRLFICFLADLQREDYARALLQLLDHHRSFGVTCGLALRDDLPDNLAVDAVVFAEAAVLVEEEQGDADYTEGRSTVYFTDLGRWAPRVQDAWSHGGSAGLRLQGYEAAASAMVTAGCWDEARIRAWARPN